MSNEYLEWELEREREWRRQMEDDAERRRQRRQQERQEAWEHKRRSADTWPEALRKQASLFANESSFWVEDDDFPDDYFGPGSEACLRAIELWESVTETRQDDIDALKRQIAEIEDAIRLEVAEKLASENGISGWQSVANAIEEDVNLTGWLNW